MAYFSKDELVELGAAMAIVITAFVIVNVHSDLSLIVPAAVLGVGTAFILHELAHKFVAMRYGAAARFVAWESGLVLTLVFSLMGALFAMPGAVYIFSPSLTRRQNGVISLAGPFTNLVSGVLLFIAAYGILVGSAVAGFGLTPLVMSLFVIARFAADLNFFLGAFNMIPVPPLDGSKVIAWNVFAWAGLSAVLVFLAFFIKPF